MKRFRGLIIFAALIGGCFATEYVTHRRLNPTGRVSSLSEYLAWRPSATWSPSAADFAVVDVDGKQHVIAYGPKNSWLLLASGPSAYIFDDTGRLVDWSSDIGDDGEFDRRWNAQRSFDPARSIPRAEADRIAATQPAG
jgi:hypothetical protein